MRSVNLTGANQQIVTLVQFGYYYGLSVKETSGTNPAALVIWDGTSATGKILDEVNLSANESTRELYFPAKTPLLGIFVQIVSGTVTGSIFFD